MSETNVQLFPGVFRTTQGGSNPDFFLHSAGRVGIGNDAPGDVVPPGSSSGTFKLNVTGHANVSGTMQANKYYGDGSTLSGVAAVIGGYWDLDQANNNIKYDIGNVGIGGNPACALDIAGEDVMIRGNTPSLHFSEGTNGMDGAFRIHYDGANQVDGNNFLAIQHGTNFADTSLHCTRAGHVGIATSSPEQNLHVHESGSGQVVIAVTNDTTGGGNNDGIHFGIDSSEQGFVWHKQNTALLFATNNAERMRINNVGDVGIGGNPGTEKLKVHGAMTVQGQTRTSSPTVVKTWNAFNNNTSAGEYTFEARSITLAHFHYSSGEDPNISESYLISCSDSGSPVVDTLKHAGYLHVQVYSDRKVRFWAQGLPSNYNSTNFHLRISAIWKMS